MKLDNKDTIAKLLKAILKEHPELNNGSINNCEICGYLRVLEADIQRPS